MKGPSISSDTEERWCGICQIARDLEIQIHPELTIQLEREDASAPESGHPHVKRLLSVNVPFTALFAYNDNSAIGAIREIQSAGLRVPEDISVVGFDDIPGAAYCNPRLTTVRQPLQKMGEIAALTLFDRIEHDSEYLPEIAIKPEFVVRESTGRAPSQAARA
jgi:LacI family transcriptional regulator